MSCVFELKQALLLLSKDIGIQMNLLDITKRCEIKIL